MTHYYDKQSLTAWYKRHNNKVNHIVNDLLKQTFEGLMHVYAYAAKLLNLEHVVSQQDYPTLFSNSYTIVKDRRNGVRVQLLHEFNLRLRQKTIDNTLCWWLLCGGLYEELVSKADELLKGDISKIKRFRINKFIKDLVATSLQNGIKTQEQWDRIFKGKETGNDTMNSGDVEAFSSCGMKSGGKQKMTNANNPKGVQLADTSAGMGNKECALIHQIPPELDTPCGHLVIQAAIKYGFSDDQYNWLKSKMLLSYFCEIATDMLHLSIAVQDGQDKTSYKPFTQLYGITGLRGGKNKYKNGTGKLPRGHEIVDELFDNLESSEEWKAAKEEKRRH